MTSIRKAKKFIKKRVRTILLEKIIDRILDEPYYAEQIEELKQLYNQNQLNDGIHDS